MPLKRLQKIQSIGVTQEECMEADNQMPSRVVFDTKIYWCAQIRNAQSKAACSALLYSKKSINVFKHFFFQIFEYKCLQFRIHTLWYTIRSLSTINFYKKS